MLTFSNIHILNFDFLIYILGFQGERVNRHGETCSRRVGDSEMRHIFRRVERDGGEKERDGGEEGGRQKKEETAERQRRT